MKAIRTLAIPAALALIAPLAPAEELKREQDLSEKEGRPAPPLVATGWMNTPEGAALDIESLQGKVVVIDFWGTW